MPDKNPAGFYQPRFSPSLCGGGLGVGPSFLVLRYSARYAKYGPLGSSASPMFLLVLIVYDSLSHVFCELGRNEGSQVMSMTSRFRGGGWRLQAERRRTSYVHPLGWLYLSL